MKCIVKSMFLMGTLLFPFSAFAQIEPYKSLNEVCVVEKRGDGYFFLNGNEIKARQKEIFGKTTRNNFEWFYTEKEDVQNLYYQIKAKVYPQMRDAIIEAPNKEMKTTVRACALTQDNQRLAASVGYQYISKDKVCVCLADNGKTNCSISAADLRNAPMTKWVPFFETSFQPSVIIGVVPDVVFQAILGSPKDYKQKIVPCENNTSNQAIVEEYDQSN